MRVMSCNTLFGGWDGDDDRRFGLQREVVAETQPDILLLQEGKQFDCNGGRRLYEVEEALGMRAFLALAPRTGQNTAILLRPGIKPVAFETDGHHFHHAAAIATLHCRPFQPEPGTNRARSGVQRHRVRPLPIRLLPGQRRPGSEGRFVHGRQERQDGRGVRPLSDCR